jgi:signal transduction histidine kinase
VRALLLANRSTRLRLTLLYAGLFLLLGTVLIGLIYGLTRSSSAAISAAPIQDGTAPSPRAALIVPGAGAQQQADLRHLLAVSWLVLAASAGAAAVLGWFAAGLVLRPARNRLEALFAAQRRFVANASHELRTPLTLERTLLELALSEPDASAETLRATCEELLVSGRDQERLLEALLTLASSEQGITKREPVDLAAIAEQALAQAGSERLELEVQAQLHPAPTSGDRSLLERMTANLIDNAVDHNLPGGRLEVTTGLEGARAVLTVTNSGPVIEADEAARLFEPFHRGAATRTGDRNGHHGLGLSIVRAIADAHEATVTARPRPGGGLAVSVQARSEQT